MIDKTIKLPKEALRNVNSVINQREKMIDVLAQSVEMHLKLRKSLGNVEDIDTLRQICEGVIDNSITISKEFAEFYAMICSEAEQIAKTGKLRV